MSDTATPTTRTPKQTVGALYDAFGAGDIPGLLAFIHPDVDWSLQVDAPDAALVPMFRNGRGHDAVMAYFGGVAQLEFHRFEPKLLLEHGDTVVSLLEMEWTHRTTGKRKAFEEVHVFTVRDGLVTRYRPFLDTATFIDGFRP